MRLLYYSFIRHFESFLLFVSLLFREFNETFFINVFDQNIFLYVFCYYVRVIFEIKCDILQSESR